MNIGKIQRVSLREVWKHEAQDFTPWLQDNIEVLNDVIDLNLANAEREKSAGSFNVDLVAEDDSGNPVIIENQLEKSNHDHLGKLITYLTAIDASAAVWIVASPRPEHINAMTWLNESSSGAFYLVKVEAVRIAESPPAPLLTLIVGPSEEAREVGETKKDLAERYILRRKFWETLLENAREKTTLHSNISPSKDGWVATGAGKSGLGFHYGIRKHDAQVELYIDRGKDMELENKTIFDTLAAAKEKVENAFGSQLEWQRLDSRRACRIRKVINLGGYRDEEKWHLIQDAMIEAMMCLEKSLRPEIKKLKI